jgi:nucleotide-binding universal stress UspA family protein
VIEWGSWLAGQFGSQLDVVHVVPDHRAHLEGIDFDPQWRNQMIAGATHRFDDLQRAWNTNYAIHVECGDVPQTLWKTAEVAAADLMVIGRGHHDGALGRLRSNAYAILREAPCPVIAI